MTSAPTTPDARCANCGSAAFDDDGSCWNCGSVAKDDPAEKFQRKLADLNADSMKLSERLAEAKRERATLDKEICALDAAYCRVNWQMEDLIEGETKRVSNVNA